MLQRTVKVWHQTLPDGQSAFDMSCSTFNVTRYEAALTRSGYAALALQVQLRHCSGARVGLQEHLGVGLRSPDL